MKILILLVALTLSQFSYGNEGKYFINSILTDENGMVTEIGIKYYQPSKMQVPPNQYILSGKDMLARGLKDLKIVEKTEEYNIYEFKISLEKYDHIFGNEELSYKTEQSITWPFIEIEKSDTFVPILISKKWVIGFSIGDISNDPFVKKWFEQ